MSDREPLTPWETIESRYLMERFWLKVREDRVRTASGTVIDQYHIIESPSWAAIVCRTDDDHLVMVEQYRHGLQGTSFEFPAGVIEPGEDPALAAQRELLEETGYVADEWRSLLEIRPEPARHSNTAHFYFAAGGRLSSEQNLDDTEDVRVLKVHLSEFEALLSRLTHGVHIGALLLAERRGWLA